MDISMDFESNRKDIETRLEIIRRRQKSFSTTPDPEVLSLIHDIDWLMDLVERFVLNKAA